jgi:hypothetical protein
MLRLITTTNLSIINYKNKYTSNFNLKLIVFVLTALEVMLPTSNAQSATNCSRSTRM